MSASSITATTTTASESAVINDKNVVATVEMEEEDNCVKLPDEETPLQVASSRGHLDCVENLVENGAAIDVQDQTGQTSLHLALRRKHKDIALYLINKGCGLNICDNNGNTPLHVASESDLPAIVQTLCEAGADINIQNLQGLSPVHIASRNGNVEVVRQLCIYGANINLKTTDGLTAEIIAFSQEDKQIASLLYKIKLEKTRKLYIDQLDAQNRHLSRIKLKVFGHPSSRKHLLLQMLQNHQESATSKLKRFSDNIFNYAALNGSAILQSFDNAAAAVTQNSARSSCKSPSTAREDSTRTNGTVSSDVKSTHSSSISSNSSRKTWPTNNGGIHCDNEPIAEVNDDVKGIEIQNATFPNCGEFSIWDFSGYDTFHGIYDHFVGNTDCVHCVVIRCSADTTEEYKQLIYWFNFLKGRLTPSEPLGHCGVVARRSVVAVAGTYSGAECPMTRTEAEAMMRTLKLRFESHFEISDQIFLVNLSNPASGCQGLKSLKEFLGEARQAIIDRLPRPLVAVEPTIEYLKKLRDEITNFPCITWPYFTNLVRDDVNPLITDSHCRQLIQQLQLIGEVVYLRDEFSEIDYIVLTPDWLGTHIIGTLFTTNIASHPEGIFSPDDFVSIFPEVVDPRDILHLMAMLQLCAPIDGGAMEFEFPQFLQIEAPKQAWMNNRLLYTYGGMRIKPVHGMESSLQSIFPRIQVALRRSMQDFKDPLDALLNQWRSCSKMLSTNLEAFIRQLGEAIEIQVRGPAERAASCFYFLEDLANLIEQTAMEVAPGIPLERHFLSPKHLRELRPSPAIFPPEKIMEMQQKQALVISNSDDEEEKFMDVVCFGSKEIAALLLLGVDTSVANMSFAARSELASLLDPPDSMGRDWSILAVKLGLMEQLPEVDSGGKSLSRTDQLLSEWALRSPEYSTIGKLCAVLQEMGREDAKTLLYRRTPLYQFIPLHEQTQILNHQNG